MDFSKFNKRKSARERPWPLYRGVQAGTRTGSPTTLFATNQNGEQLGVPHRMHMLFSLGLVPQCGAVVRECFACMS